MGILGKAFNFETDCAYQKALEYAQEFEPVHGVEYDWVIDYAGESYKMFFEGAQQLDAKADSIIRYLGAFSGVAAFVGSYVATSAEWWVAVSAVPAFVSALAAITFAARARRTMNLPTPPVVKDAIRYANAYEDKACATFVPHVGAAAVGMKAVLTEKGQQIDKAICWYLVASYSLALPLALSILRRALGWP